MIKRVMLLGVGAAVGWLGHTAFSRGRDAAVVRAEESLRTTFHPDTIGRNAGQAAATALAASARSFAYQLREEVPAWKTLSDTLAEPRRPAPEGATGTTIRGTTVPGAADGAEPDGGSTGGSTGPRPTTTERKQS